MKMKNRINKLLRSGLFAATAVSLMASCSTDEVTYKAGTKPDKEALETVAGTLRSSKSLRDRVSISVTEGNEDAVTDKIYFRLNRPVDEALSLTAVPDPSLVDVYNAKFNTKLQPLPLANISLAGNGKITVPAGTRESARIDLTIQSDGLEPGIYLMPVALDGAKDEADPKVLYYGVTVREFDENILQEGDMLYNVDLDERFKMVFYLNTSEAQAHYADYAAFAAQDDGFNEMYRTTLGNIIVLRISMVDYDPTSQRAVFAPTSDLRYTVEHDSKYLAQMRDKGRKLCICIEGGGKGIGFCNMNDAQIADFVQQVKAFITLYNLDGVNLWDRGSGYGKEGMPPVNTTSYPKLIKALREAMPDKMLTVVDYEEPTASFFDTELTGGIAVGDYIDYAWHGYASKNEANVLVNPYNTSTMYQQPISRKPFAGLEDSRYGNVFLPMYPDNSVFISENVDWLFDIVFWNMERTNNLVVFDDLALPAALSYETGYLTMIATFFMPLYMDLESGEMGIYNVFQRVPGIFRQSGKNYETFYKDW